jgi:hypothetical protein
MILSRPLNCVAIVAAIAAGCTSSRKTDDEARASSLVYSPAARLPAGRGGHAASDATSTTDIQQDAVRPPAGRRCRLHLRREAVGVAGQVPYPITGNNLAADRAQLTGTLERVGRDWLVIRGERSTYWVPREAVLAVEFVEQ